MLVVSLLKLKVVLNPLAEFVFFTWQKVKS